MDSLCKRCNVTKPVSEFYAQAARKAVRPYCKECTKDFRNTLYKNPTKGIRGSYNKKAVKAADTEAFNLVNSMVTRGTTC